MKIAYFDTVAGIAGDMTIASCLSAGVRLDDLVAGLSQLGLDGYEVLPRHVRRSSINAVHVDVAISHQPHIHRTLKGIAEIITASSLPPAVQQKAIEIFRVLAQAEAAVHGTSVEQVHFHEVGALDSIIDIVGASICLELLGIERIYSSPVRLGRGGIITTQHGPMPTPAPATLELLRGYPVEFTSFPYELTTPTGAAIIRALSCGTLDAERIEVQAVGYGAGTKEFPELPNFLRLVVGTLTGDAGYDEVTVIETNIDDMNPQVYPVLIERLLAAGAHDAYLVPVVMKKGRPGILLSAMVPPHLEQNAIALIYRETSTIGVRVQHISRRKLARRETTVATSFGPVRAKAVVRDGREAVAPEFEECKRIALERGLPLLEVMRTLEQELRTRGTV